MASQDQNIDHSNLDHSQIQQDQAGRDAVSFQNSHDNRVIIENTFLRLFGKSESSQVDWEWGKRLLKEKQLPEIKQRLNDTLGSDRIFMDVSVEEQPSWVNRSPLEANRRLQIDGEDCGIIDPNKMLIETFGRDDIGGKLLILGAPGGGKTTALLSLAEQLVCGALEKPKTVIPVIFELSTWRDDKQSIHDWLIEQLYDLHGGNRKSKIYEKWLEKQILLPLLDGLDELGLERQKKCTLKLNEFARSYPQLVVCCRVREFETVNIKLRHLRGAVCLQPLSDGQIEAYLHSIHRPELWSAMQTNPALQALLKNTSEGDSGLLRVPLFVNLTADVYDPNNPILSKKNLLERYIERQLSFDRREGDRYKAIEKRQWAYKTVEAEPKFQETINALSWIARQLQSNNTVDLLIEQMQPSWIESKGLRWRYRLILGLILGVISGVSFGVSLALNSALISGLIFVLISGLIFVLIFVLISGLTEIEPVIEPVEAFEISMSPTTRQKFFERFRFGLITFLIFVLIGALTGVIGVLTSGLTGLIVMLIFGLKQELKVRIRPNQGIWNSLQSMIWITAFISLVNVILLNTVIRDFSVSLMNGILLALILGFGVGGGVACVQHLSLRLILWQSGTIPWDFAQFLNYCVERRLLLRIGGRYRFLHRELLDHFAQFHHS